MKDLFDPSAFYSINSAAINLMLPLLFSPTLILYKPSIGHSAKSISQSISLFGVFTYLQQLLYYKINAHFGQPSPLFCEILFACK